MKLVGVLVLSLISIHLCFGFQTTFKNNFASLDQSYSFQSLDCCSSLGCSFPAGLTCCSCASSACLACFSTPVAEACGSGTFNSTTYPTCTLTLSNYTHCANICPNWLFIASLTSIVNFVNQVTPTCIVDECRLQSQLIGQDCCNSSDICDNVCGTAKFTLASVQQTLILTTKQKWVNNVGCLSAFNNGSDILHSNSPILAWITLPDGDYEIITIIGSKGFWRGSAGTGANDFYFQYLISDPTNSAETWVNENTLCSNYNNQGGKWTNSLYIQH